MDVAPAALSNRCRIELDMSITTTLFSVCRLVSLDTLAIKYCHQAYTREPAIISIESPERGHAA
jgi:hypothetical protein